MRLRSIDIGGYKSFGVRTELRFDGGMTAVVGPNGSGKSNIMDALRWVIGEGANRSLRVKRLDEVIFTGSSERAPAGLAEVRLRLDNGDGWLGLDAAEVEVQRRVHRDGESEFRLNGRAVRLREIQELFHNSGLGSGGYALMGQGLVDEVLRLRPQERRRLIEEVADVRRHRRKMLESRRQRERAEQHLDRARLLRDELAPRLRSLERQARRARRHEELQAELNTALGAWYGASVRALAAELNERADAATSAAAAQQQAGLELSAVGAAVTAAEQAVEAARADVNAAAAGRRAAEAEVNELRHALELDQRRHDWLRSEADSLESNRDPAEDTLAPAPDLVSAGAALQAAEASLHDARKQRDLALREHDARLQRRAEAAALTRRLDAERAQLRSEARALGRTWPTRLTTLHELEEGRVEAREAAAEVATALEAARADEARAAGDLQRERDAHAAITAQRDAIRREIDDLDARIAAFEELAAPSASNGASGGSANGVAPRLRSQLRVRRGYEAAVEAALGAAADAELQPTASAALARAEAALRDDGQAWLGVAADLVSRDGAPAARTRAAASGNGARPATAVGAMTVADAVEAPANLRAVVSAMLGEIWIAEGASAARAMLAAASPPRAVVTRDGILLRGDGVVATRSGQSASWARQQRRVAEWRERRERLARALDQQPTPDADALTQVQRAHEDSRAAVRRCAERQTVADAALREASRALQIAEAERERLRGDALRLQSRLRRLRADAVEAAAIDRDAVELTPAPADHDLTELERERDGAAGALSDARAALERERRQAQVGARLTAIREELTALSATLDERRAAVVEAVANAADATVLEAARARLRQSEAERARARVRLEAAQTVRVAAERAAVEAQAALRETEAARERLSADAAEDHIDLSDLPAAEGDISELRAAAMELRGRLHRLGSIQPEAADDHAAELERYEAIEQQIVDLEATEQRLRGAERELETLIDSRFRAAFGKVNAAFERYFRLMFRGGQARLALTDEGPAESDGGGDDDDAEADAPPPGVDISAQPPGKRVANLTQLSGGERALTAIALLFALLEIRPVPFCVLDEVDAALDEANVERFVQALKERAADMQFVVITHNRRTIEQADAIYGVTMGTDGLSKILSVRLDDIDAA